MLQLCSVKKHQHKQLLKQELNFSNKSFVKTK